MDARFPFVTHETYGKYLNKLNNHLERKMKGRRHRHSAAND